VQEEFAVAHLLLPEVLAAYLVEAMCKQKRLATLPGKPSTQYEIDSDATVDRFFPIFRG
jgi:hypothetical protein